ncbi:hypothetical protein CC86DRAFT_402009 [Ophiobolus disseminans]|uniref:Uncharacterized protein n=1 Tax=Ophiobolus disseminans TaxID=1469910 RepID=A0A6A7AFI8_9PLEO|nr:hypothetical protein CC86DRAFT_402009 [Ophiobolus disseminans]
MPALSFTIVLHTLNILIGILSAAILALVVHSVILIKRMEALYPQDVKRTGHSLLFWPGVGGIVDMLLFIFLWLQAPHTGGMTKKLISYWNSLLFVTCFIFGRPFVVLIYTFVEYGHATKGQILPLSGYITPETWTCAAAGRNNLQTARSMCTQLRAARYLLILEVVIGAIMLCLMIWIRIQLRKEEKSVKPTATPEIEA